ncbi:MAG: AMP-binding protein, partial [Gemmatimonadota bacterium]
MTDIDVLLQEHRKFPPDDAFRNAANIRSPEIYENAARDYEAFWAACARELEWSKPFTGVLDWKPPRAKWFMDGELNASVNCVDRHARGARRDKKAIVWEGEPGDARTLTYAELLDEVSRFASVLDSLGVKRGDRVAIYLPMIPEAAIAMLGCARVGAVHSVVFGGFSAESLRDR